MASRRLYEIIGIACGLILLNYGFNLLASGFPGTRQLTSQFLGVDLLIGGSAVVFISLYFLLKLPTQVTPTAQPAGSAPDVGVELIVEEEPPTPSSGVAPAETSQMPSPAYPEILHMDISEFSKSGSGEYERQLTPGVYDMFRIERETVTVWRENREGMRSVYMAGPYELSRKLMEEYIVRGEELRIGYLTLPVDALRDLVRLQEQPAQGLKSAAG